MRALHFVGALEWAFKAMESQEYNCDKSPFPAPVMPQLSFRLLFFFFF